MRPFDRFRRFTARGLALVVMVIGVPFASAVATPYDTVGENEITLDAPEAATDFDRILLVWTKPAWYREIVDYQVSMDGEVIGTALPALRANSSAQRSIDAFYADDLHKDHVRITPHSFLVTGLAAATEHSFEVRAIRRDGTLSAASNAVVRATLPSPTFCDVAAAGARGDGETINTSTIQSAIDGCPAGGVVVIPRGIFKTGALYLKSDLTLDLEDGSVLQGSDRAADYPRDRGGRLDGVPNAKPPALINADDPSCRHAGCFRNIRIVGHGTIDGSGWQTDRTALDAAGALVAEYAKGNRDTVGDRGRLAARQVEAATATGIPEAVAYAQFRSSLAVLNGVDGLYIGTVTWINPAFHALTVSHSENVVVDGAVVRTWNANNGDGLDLGYSRHAIVLNSLFDTGDDAIAMAAGAGRGASSQMPTSDIWIVNSFFGRGHGAVVLGSRTGAWIEKVLAEDNVIDGNDAPFRAKTDIRNGGGGRDVVFRDTPIRNPRQNAFQLTLQYGDPNAMGTVEPAEAPATFRDMVFRNITVRCDSLVPRGHDEAPPAAGRCPSITILGDRSGRGRNEHILFDNVILRDAAPATLEALADGRFHNVMFQGQKAGAELWRIGPNVTTLVFDGSTRPPR